MQWKEWVKPERERRQTHPGKRRKKRSGGDTIEWLREKAAADKELKEKDLEEKQAERESKKAE